ncbi:MAG: hypothetical protein ACK2TV_00230 [Anaerolineales bacterium]
MKTYARILGSFLVIGMLALIGCARTATHDQESAPATPISTTATPPLSQSLQLSNNLPRTQLSPRTSQDLPDNHIGVHTEGFDRYSESTDDIVNNGFKRLRIQSLTDFGDEGFGVKTFFLESIPPEVDQAISNYLDHGVMISLDLWLGTGFPIHFTDYDTNYKSEEEINAYLDYVRFVVGHFKGRIASYEILNEPGYISVGTYTNLIQTVVPVIRGIDPDAQIIIGSVPGSWENGFPGYGKYQRFKLDVDMLNELLRSDVVSLVDGISWHPFYDNMPGDPYYQDYPQIVQGIKDLAASQGFEGEYFADELLWRTVTEEGFAGGPPLSRPVAAKYYTRAIAEHRGLGLNVTVNIFFQSPFLAPIHNLNDTLAGAEPTDIIISINTDEGANLRYYGFILPGGDKLVALWTNDEAVVDDPGVSATLTFPGFSNQSVTGIDIFNSFEQELVTERMGSDLVIRNLLVKDYPIILHFVEKK